jgi:hypothetical protein
MQKETTHYCHSGHNFLTSSEKPSCAELAILVPVISACQWYISCQSIGQQYFVTKICRIPVVFVRGKQRNYWLVRRTMPGCSVIGCSTKNITKPAGVTLHR